MNQNPLKIADVIAGKYADFLDYCAACKKVYVSELTDFDYLAFKLSHGTTEAYTKFIKEKIERAAKAFSIMPDDKEVPFPKADISRATETQQADKKTSAAKNESNRANSDNTALTRAEKNKRNLLKISDVIAGKYADFLDYCAACKKVYVSELTDTDYAVFRVSMGKTLTYIQTIQNQIEYAVKALNDNEQIKTDVPAEITLLQPELCASSCICDGKPDDKSIAALLGAEASGFSQFSIDLLALSVRAKNCLYRAKYKTIGDVLELTTEKLMSIHNLGIKSANEVIEKLTKFISNGSPAADDRSAADNGIAADDRSAADDSLTADETSVTEKAYQSQENVCIISNEKIKNAIEAILLEDDYSAESMTNAQTEQLTKMKAAADVLGNEICLEAYLNPHYVTQICDMLSEFSMPFIQRMQAQNETDRLIGSLPDSVKKRKAIPFINAYKAKRVNQLPFLLSLCNENTAIGQIPLLYETVSQTEDLAALKTETSVFLNWLNFDMDTVIADTFENIKEFFSSHETQCMEVLLYRAAGKTLEEIGNIYNVTRERIRQLESKAYRIFWRVYSKQKYDLIMLAYALRDGDNILYYNKIEEILGDSAKILWKCIRHFPYHRFYYYSKALDAVIVCPDKSLFLSENDLLSEVDNDKDKAEHSVIPQNSEQETLTDLPAAKISKPEAAPDTKGETHTEAASEIDILLNDELFSPLRAALANENIRTLEELKALKLWAFMNRNNLYSIPVRQTVFAKVGKLLEPQDEKNPARLYKLRCGSVVYFGNTPAKAFLHFCEAVAYKYPLFFRSLLGRKIGNPCTVKIHRFAGNGNFLKMGNPVCFINAELGKSEVLSTVDWICQQHGNERTPVSLEEPKNTAVQPDFTQKQQASTPDAIISPAKQNSDVYQRNIQAAQSIGDTDTALRAAAPQKDDNAGSEQVIEAEKLVLYADMNGTTYDELRDALHTTMVTAKALAAQCSRVVEINGRLYHEDAFIDWSEGAKQMCDIMEKLMQRNNGYVSAAQLYDYACSEMYMFLNDNDLKDERAVYEIAQHLFEKNSYGGNRFSFSGKIHIFMGENQINSNFDVICKFAEAHGGVFKEADLNEYLIKMGIKSGNLRSRMRIGKEPDFFIYEPGTIISAKSMGMDLSWKKRVCQAIKNLLNDADDHVILRKIQPVWFETLPVLPGRRCWTPLLLQYVLRFFGKEFGAKTIAALEFQSMDTLHAMLVKYDGEIQNFGDAVICCLIENEIEQRSFGAEELRRHLVKSGMIQGNELIWNMPKALAKDGRFAWDAKGENVTVRV